MAQPPSLVGSIVERVPSAAPKAPRSSNTSGFPAVQHRSKSAFSRGREELKRKSEFSLDAPPVIQVARRTEPVASGATTSVGQEDPFPLITALSSSPSLSKETEDDWRRQMSEENEKRVASMTDAEREEERREVLSKFGPGLGDVLKRARAKREGAMSADSAGPSQDAPRALNRSAAPPSLNLDMQELTRPSVSAPSTPRPLTPVSALAGSHSRPSSRADRRLRFADVTPNDVHVYESAPSSPRKKALALPPPSVDDTTTISLGQWKGKLPSTSIASPRAGPASSRSLWEMDTDNPSSTRFPTSSDRSVDEGTPEYIRRRFFPHVPAHDPSLEWIEGPSSNISDASAAAGPASTSLRLDLSGRPIPPALSGTLPTHLGLHHHAEGAHAGYTLDDVFLLSRSTVPAQRAAMMGVLRGLARRLSAAQRGTRVEEDRDSDELAESLNDVKGQEEGLRKRILAAGASAMGERGSLGALGVEVVWECVVGWEGGLSDEDGIELRDIRKATAPMADPNRSGTGTDEDTKTDAIGSLPLEPFLLQVADAFSAASLPPSSLLQLLSVLHRLAQHTNALAARIIRTTALIPALLRTFLLTPIPAPEDAPPPSPLALRTLTLIARASRENAVALVSPADALLRFVAAFPASPYPPALATELLTGTLRFYAVLARYGLYASIATTAAEPLARVRAHVLTLDLSLGVSHRLFGGHRLACAWLDVITSWTACAADPHATSPPHEILWSQVCAWGWPADVAALADLPMLGAARVDWPIWTAAWNAQAVWLEGARVNGVRAGAGEREAALKVLKEGFRELRERSVVDDALQVLRKELDAARVEDLTEERLKAISDASSVLAAVIRLWLACTEPPTDANGSGNTDATTATTTAVPAAGPPFLLPFTLLSTVCQHASIHPVWSLVLSPSTPSPSLCNYLRPLSTLLSAHLRLTRQTPNTPPSLWLAQALAVLPCLLPGDEATAHWTFAELTRLLDAPLLAGSGVTIPDVVWARGGLRPLAPFFTYAVGTARVGALSPRMGTDAIQGAQTLRLAPASALWARVQPAPGLPLPRGWTLGALDHLLRSGTAGVFGPDAGADAVPAGWDCSETEVARAALALAVVERAARGAHGFPGGTGAAEAVLGCMKVFMLEHGLAHHDSMDEVFRDGAVEALMRGVLAPFSAAARPAPSPADGADEPLEAAATRFLGPGTPFFQFYSDFVGLYDAISFAHALFGALLLPPLAMGYAADYRRLLWGDYAHALRGVRVPVGEVVLVGGGGGGGAGAFLWPAEDEAEVLGAYVRALVRGEVREGVLRLIAVHHVACRIWPDLRALPAAGAGAGAGATGTGDERARRLLSAVVEQGGFDAVREVVLYRPYAAADAGAGRELGPPECFGQDGAWKGERMAWVRGWAGERVQGRLAGLLAA